jgi:hypothetical protein
VLGVSNEGMKTENPRLLAQRAMSARLGPRTKGMEDTMTVLLTLEASQPCGKTYRLGIGCNLHLASMLALLTRLF